MEHNRAGIRNLAQMKRSLEFYSKISQKGMNRIPIHRDELTVGNKVLLTIYTRQIKY